MDPIDLKVLTDLGIQVVRNVRAIVDEWTGRTLALLVSSDWAWARDYPMASGVQAARAVEVVRSRRIPLVCDLLAFFAQLRHRVRQRHAYGFQRYLSAGE